MTDVYGLDDETLWQLRSDILKAASGFISYAEGKNLLPGWMKLPTTGATFSKVGAAMIPTLATESAEQLVASATTDPHAFDLASYIAAMNLIADYGTDGFSLILPLRLFASQVLMGEISRPPQRGRPFANDTILRMQKYGMCQFISQCGPVQLSRNRDGASLGLSACDLVAEGFSKAGNPTTYEFLVSLCYDKPNQYIRDLADYIGLTNFEADE